MQQFAHGDIWVLRQRRKLAAASAAAAADAGAPAAAAALLHASLGASVRTQYLAGLVVQLASLYRRRARRGCAYPDPIPDAGGEGRDEVMGEEEEGRLAACAPDRQGRCGGAARSGAAAESDQDRVCDPDPDDAQRTAWLRAAAVLRADGEWARGGAAGDLAALEVRTMPQ